MGYVVTELFACIATDEDGDEGVIAAQIGDALMPLVCADLVRMQQFIPIAMQIKEVTGITLAVKHFQLLGSVDDEYLEQFKDPPVTDTDDPGDTSDPEQKPERRRSGNGSTPHDT